MMKNAQSYIIAMNQRLVGMEQFYDNRLGQIK
jgi:hypothetical protein